jgi:ATP-dependent HslUV protease, peptidase subunit HslV
LSTIVVVRKNSTVAIAVDSLTTSGYTKMDSSYSDSMKILKMGDSYFATVGSPAHQHILRSVFDEEKEPPTFRSTMEIFEYFRKLQNRLIDDYHLISTGNKSASYETIQMSILIANPHGIFGMESDRVVFEYKKFWSMGAGNEFALGAMFATYDSGMTSRQIAEIGVRAGIEFNDSTAGPVVSYEIPIAS